MNNSRKLLALALSWLCSFSLLPAQDASIAPMRPSAPVFWRPYLSTDVPPARMVNSPRLRDMVRAGKLYLTAQDAIALALENNIDVEVARYNPLIAAWNLERAQAGGALPGVPSSASQAGAVASGQGVFGSQAAAGVTAGPSTASTTTSTNASIAQIGPVTQTLDPTFQDTSTFSHKTTPQPDTIQSGVLGLVDDTRVYTSSLQEGFLSGGSVTVTYSEHYLNENAPSDVLNPSEAPNLSISAQQYLLNGFGVAVNARTITVAKIGLKTSDLAFRTQVIGIVASVLNAYYVLSADYENVRASQTAVDVAEKFYQDNRKQVDVGTLAPLDLTTAESQAAASQRDLVVAETGLEEDEITLKNMLSRNGLADPVLASARIVPTDRIAMPPSDDLPPVSDLVKQALANRTAVSGLRHSQQCRPGRGASDSESGRVRGEARPVFRGRPEQRPGPALTKQLSFAGRRLLLPRTDREPAGAGRLRDRSASASADAASHREGSQPGAGGRYELGGGAAAGARAIRRRGAQPDPLPATPGCRAEEVRAGSVNALCGGARGTRPRDIAVNGDLGAGQL
ncbi:MAG: TolC family protein [Bryobacteraceae bacterium]